MQHHAIFLSVALAVATLALDASAQQADVPTAATWSDGSPITGTITSVRVGIDVTVLRPDGTSETVPWSSIRLGAGALPARVHVSVDGSAPWGGASTPPTPPAPPTALVEFSRTPRDGDVPIVLESVDATLMLSAFEEDIAGTNAKRTRFLCATPCTLYATPGTHSLHVGGDGLRPRDVTVDVDGEGSLVRLHGATLVRPLGALVSIAFGSITGLAGAMFLGVGAGVAADGGRSVRCSTSVSASAGGTSASATSGNCDAGFLIGIGTGFALTGGGMLTLGGYLASGANTRVVSTQPLGTRRVARLAHRARLRFGGAALSPVANGRGAMGGLTLAF